MNTNNNHSEVCGSRLEEFENLLKNPLVNSIIEWTFSYDSESMRNKTPYCVEFFQSIDGGMSYAQFRQNPQEAGERLMQNAQNQIKKYISHFRSFQNHILADADTVHKVIHLGAIDANICSLEMAYDAVTIEMEKALGYQIMSDDDYLAYRARQENRMMLLYGPSIGSSRDLIEKTIVHVEAQMRKQSHVLTSQERERFEQILSTIKERSGSNFCDASSMGSESDLHKKTSELLQNIESIRIPQEVYIQLFQLYINLLGLHQKVGVNPDRSSIYDGPDTLEFPKNEARASMSLREILSLMFHEIGVHYVTQKNHKALGFFLRGAGNVTKDEGLASIVEDLFAGNKLHSIAGDPGFSFIFSLAADFDLPADDQKDLVQLWLKVNNPSYTIDAKNARYLRVIRGFRPGGGSQWKDNSYGVGKFKIATEVLRGTSLSNFWVGKLSIEDCISHEIQTLALSHQQSTLFPILLPEILLYVFGAGRKEFRKNGFEGFRLYILDKYQGIFTAQELSRFGSISDWTRLRTIVITMHMIQKYSKE